jgi:hypothetical protein
MIILLMIDQKKKSIKVCFHGTIGTDCFDILCTYELDNDLKGSIAYKILRNENLNIVRGLV